MQADILDQIVDRRRQRVLEDGAAQGLDLPAARPNELPVVAFPPPLICEIKRRSPSRGQLAPRIDPVERAGVYRDAGAAAVSVLTEQDHFSGALADLIAVKAAYPELAVLRKDFLLTRADIETAWRAGADAVLLIAAILDRQRMGELLRAADEVGLAALVEIHDREDLARIRALRPAVVGINSRNLRTFRVDLLDPLALATEVDWDCTLVYESGVFHEEDARLARSGGFSSILVGEAVVREPGRVGRLAAVMNDDIEAAGARATGHDQHGAMDAQRTVSAPPRQDFWTYVAARRGGAAQHEAGGPSGMPQHRAEAAGPRGMPHPAGLDPHRAEAALPPHPAGAPSGASLPPHVTAPARPLVKICGITNVEDAQTAVALGADLLGLVYAPSPRRAPEGLARRLRDAGIGVALVAVVVEPGDDGHVERAIHDRQAGHISALQLHGGTPDVLTYGWPAFRALRPKDPSRVAHDIAAERGPRVLIDAYDPDSAGGTGTSVRADVLGAVQDALWARPHGALWLAGGLGPDNVGAVIKAYQPELIDASSRLEAKPGRKDPAALRAFFAEIDTFTRATASAAVPDMEA